MENIISRLKEQHLTKVTLWLVILWTHEMCIRFSASKKKMANTDQWLKDCPKDTEQQISCSTFIVYP